MSELTIDCRGETGPGPLDRTRQALAGLNAGDLLFVEVDHAPARRDIPRWAEQSGHACEVDRIDRGEWEIIIQKAG